VVDAVVKVKVLTAAVALALLLHALGAGLVLLPVLGAARLALLLNLRAGVYRLVRHFGWCLG